MHHPSLRFVHRGRVVTLTDVPPDRTLLDVLREDMGLTGTKEGCASGDCGACTVVLADAIATPKAQAPSLRWRTVNSCIRLAHSINGMALWTVQDLHVDPLLKPVVSQPTAQQLHPAQQAMVDCHGAQCGFCTPGVVMSLFGLYQQTQADHASTTHCTQPCNPASANHSSTGNSTESSGGSGDGSHSTTPSITRQQAHTALSGNLCRCTGYRPIVDAAIHMASLPPVRLETPHLLSLLEQTNESEPAVTANFSYISPTTLPHALAARAQHPHAQVVAGATDVGLWVTQQHRALPQVLDISRVDALCHVQWQAAVSASYQPNIDQRNTYQHKGGGALHIGAAVPLEEAWAALAQTWPTLQHFAQRFAGLPIRHAGTMGGNVANGSPIGDAMPVLLALDASVVVANAHAERTIPLAQFYTGYRRNMMAADELLVRIVVPAPLAPIAPITTQPDRTDGVQPNLSPQPSHTSTTTLMRAYKISKRQEDDISAVCLAVCLVVDAGRISYARIGAGGVAATPVRAYQTESALIGQTWSADTAQQAGQILAQEWDPLSDLRASSQYRRTVLAHLMQRFWLDIQGIATDVHADISATGIASGQGAPA